MKILVISVNREKQPLAVEPIGAAVIVSILEQAGHAVSFLDLCFTGDIKRTLTRALKRIEPEIVGLSIRNLDNCASSNQKVFYKTARRVIETIRACSSATILMGGGGVSVLPRELAEYLDISYAFIGEAEESLPVFLSEFAGSRDYTGISGLLYRNQTGWHLNPPRFTGDLDRFPLYAYNRINHKKYFENGSFIGYQTKRGCPFRCVYCNYRTLEGSRSRQRSPGLCVDDMERIVRNTGLRDFFFTDGVFNWPPEHAGAVCEEIIRRDLKIRWVAYCNPLGLDAAMARTFQTAGCVGIELGLDAVTDQMLENMGKGFVRDDIQRAYEALLGAGIPFAVFLLFGGPGDSFEAIEETQRSLIEFGKANAVFASLGLRIYRDAPIYDIAVKEGIITPDTNLLEPTYYIAARLGEDAMDRLDRLARREATWSTPTDWNSLTVKSIQKILNRFRVIPSWKDIEAYGNHMRKKC